MMALRYVGKNGSTDRQYISAVKKPADGLVILDLVSNRPNVALRAHIDGKQLYLRASPVVRDFRDITVMSYILDTLAPRTDGTDYWSRDFDCIFPVEDPKLWKANDESLTRLLSNLAGDQHQYTWLSATGMPAHPAHRTRVPKDFDAVCLFSGGIDSLMGAHTLLRQGKRLLLVGHQSEPATAAAQKEVYKQLLTIFPKQAILIQFRTALSRGEKPLFSIPKGTEDTHRVRSFLFLGLAVAVADMARIKVLYMPENGLIALNPPLDLSRLGTCSTRTAHPRFLQQFLELSKELGVYDGTLKNPFLYQSKTDMLRSFDPKLKAALLRSVSCARPSRYNNKGVRHCGYCVPCIYRRSAFTSVGLDSASDYAFDVFTQLSRMSEAKRLDFVSLFEFAKRYQLLSRIRKEAIILSHGYFTPSIGARIGPHATTDYSPWIEMLDRWTAEFVSLVDARASQSSKKSLKLSNMVRA